jgi:hypothetical protein
VASSAYSAIVPFAFTQLNLDLIYAKVIQDNIASHKVLEKMGFVKTFMKRNDGFVDGSYKHAYLLECLNPNETNWQAWWHGDEIPSANIAARKITEKVMRDSTKEVHLL